MAKKVNWENLKEELDSIFGEDEPSILDEWDDEEVISPVVNFLQGQDIEKLKDVNIELLSKLDEPDYDSHSQGCGIDTTAVFSLEDKIYRVTISHYSYKGYDLDSVQVEEVAPKIKQIIYYD